MEKNDLVEIIQKEFKPLGFKRKGNYWKLDGSAVVKIIQLQRSTFSKLYYINYGFNFVNLKYDEVSMHIFRRLGSSDFDENKFIIELLDLESNIDFESRRSSLADILHNKLKVELDRINSEADALAQIKERPVLLNMMPLKVKEYLNV